MKYLMSVALLALVACTPAQEDEVVFTLYCSEKGATTFLDSSTYRWVHYEDTWWRNGPIGSVEYQPSHTESCTMSATTKDVL